MSMGLCAFVVDLALEVLNSWKFDSVQSTIASAGGFWPPYLAFLFFTMGFSLMSACLVAFGAPLAAGSGIPEIKSYLNGVRLKGVLLVDLLEISLVTTKEWVLEGANGASACPMAFGASLAVGSGILEVKPGGGAADFQGVYHCPGGGGILKGTIGLPDGLQGASGRGRGFPSDYILIEQHVPETSATVILGLRFSHS